MPSRPCCVFRRSVFQRRVLQRSPGGLGRSLADSSPRCSSPRCFSPEGDPSPRLVDPIAPALLLVGAIVLLSSGLSAQAEWTVVAEIPLAPHDPVNAQPYGLELHPDPATALAYVALAGQVAPFGEPADLHSGHTVVEFRTDTLEVVRTFPVGFYPTELAVTSDGLELFVTTSTESTLFRIDLTSGAVTGWPVTDSLGGPVDFLSGVELSPDGTEVWVASNGGSFDGSSENFLIVDRVTGLVLDRQVVSGGLSRFAVRPDGRVVLPVGFPGDDFTAAPEIRIYDSVGWTLVATLPVVVDTADFPAPSDVALSDDGSRAYVTVFGGSTEVFVVDVDTATLMPPLDLGGIDTVQSTIDLAPGGDELVVGDFFGGRLRVIDRLTGSLQVEVPTLSLPNDLAFTEGRLFVTEQGIEAMSIIALPGSFLRGDANRDGAIDLSDGVSILTYLFSGGDLLCADAADVDDGGVIDLADAISLFTYLFQGGTPPSAPFPMAGGDSPGPDGFDCAP